MQRRETGLLAVALAIVAVALLAEPRRDVSAASPAAGNAARPGQNALPRGEVAALDVDEWLARLKARGMSPGQSGPGLFGGKNWQPPPDPAASQPARPQTPPFPFILLGRMKLGEATVVVLAKGEVSYTAKAGELVDQFRIDKIDEDGLRVTYVPNGEARDYRYEQLYASVNAAAMPGPAPQMQQPQPVESREAQARQPTAFAPAPAVKPEAGAAPGIAASPSSPTVPNVQGASAPIGGMVINPGPPGGGMVITPTAPEAAMAITPPQAGSGMIMRPVPPGIVMPGMSGIPSGTSSAPTAQ